MIKKILSMLMVAASALLMASPAGAQTVVTGHYVPTYAGGLKTSLMPPPGWTVHSISVW